MLLSAPLNINIPPSILLPDDDSFVLLGKVPFYSNDIQYRKVQTIPIHYEEVCTLLDVADKCAEHFFFMWSIT